MADEPLRPIPSYWNLAFAKCQNGKAKEVEGYF